MKAPDTKDNQPGDSAALPARAVAPYPVERRGLRRPRGRSRRQRKLRARGIQQQRHGRRLRRQGQRRHARRQAPALRASSEPHRAQLSARPPNCERVGGGRTQTETSRAVRALSITHAGAGTYDVTVTAASCRHALNNAPVVSVNDGEPPVGFGATTAFPVAWTETASTGVEAFTIHTGVVVSGEFQSRDEPFNFTDSCG